MSVRRTTRRAAAEPPAGRAGKDVDHVPRHIDVADGLARSRGGGRPLDAEIRESMEHRFRHSLADVRVHADDTASALCAAVSASAFTHGREIYVGAGNLQPRSPAGRELLAHELRHVVQPSSAPASERHEWSVGGTTVRRATPGDPVAAGQSTEPARSTAPLDLPRVLSEQRDLVVDHVLPELFLKISHREVATREPEGHLKYEEGAKLTIELSGKTSAVPYHCTDLVMNSAFLAGFEVLSGGTGYYLPADKARQRATARRPGDIIEQVPIPEDVAATPEDESKSALRPGDVMAWGPRPKEDYGHTMIIVEKGAKAGVVTVREAGSGQPRERSSRPLRPVGRQVAVYRFTTPNLARIQQNYDTDPDYRRMFDDAFELHFYNPERGPRSDDPGRYRMISRP